MIEGCWKPSPETRFHSYLPRHRPDIHGALAVGPTLLLTFSSAHALEETARVYAIARSLGQPIRELPAAEVKCPHAWWKAHRGQHAADGQGA